MRTLSLAIAAGALLVATQANAGSFPVNKLTDANGGGLVDHVAVRVYVHEGNRYCFYGNGWHGPGWYRCGYAFRRGLGWGGVYGWNNWNYGPYERRFGGRHHGERIGDTGSRRIDRGVESRTRSTTTSGVQTRTRSTTGSAIQTRTRSTTGSGVEGGARARESTTGGKPNTDVQSEGAAKVQGGSMGEGSGRGGGGGNVGGAPAGEGNSKRQ